MLNLPCGEAGQNDFCDSGKYCIFANLPCVYLSRYYIADG